MKMTVHRPEYCIRAGLDIGRGIDSPSSMRRLPLHHEEVRHAAVAACLVVVDFVWLGFVEVAQREVGVE